MRVQQRIVPIFADAHGADADAALGGQFGGGQTPVFIAIGLPVGQQDQVIDGVILAISLDFSQTRL